MNCIYCNGRKNNPRMTLEHIWPQSLGGAAAPELFRSNQVCESCNNHAGLWVDGAFTKSWFVANEAAMQDRSYLDPEKPGIVPFIYMGIDTEFPNRPDHICERWLGQAGEHIYHIHLADEDKWYGYAGGDVIRRKRDKGCAYLILTSQSTYWALTALASFAKKFKGCRLFCLTAIGGFPKALSEQYIHISNANEIEAAEIAWIKSRPDNTQQQMQLSLRLDFSDRFLAKVALGIGANLFGNIYCSSSYAGELRKLLWRNSKSDDEGSPQVFGTSFWQDKDLRPISQYISLPGAWTILLQGLKDGFALCLFTPGGRCMSMSISDDNSLWASPEFKLYHEGAVYFAIPQRDLFVGPVPLIQRIAHGLGNLVNPTLAMIESLRGDPSRLPKAR